MTYRKLGALAATASVVTLILTGPVGFGTTFFYGVALGVMWKLKP